MTFLQQHLCKNKLFLQQKRDLGALEGPWGVLGESLGSWEEFGRQKGSPRTPFGRPIFMFFCYKNVGFYTISVIWEVWGNGRVPLCLPLIFDVFLGRVFRKS